MIPSLMGIAGMVCEVVGRTKGTLEDPFVE
jgi:hypothetical protein